MILQSTSKTSFAKSKAPSINNELGTSGDSMSDLFTISKDKSYKCSIEDLRFMKDHDGTIRSLYQILRMPIMANSWRIDIADDASPAQQKAAQEQADFVYNNLTLPPYKGGMTTSFRLVIARSLRAVLEGYSLAEKVFTLNDQGKIIYKKIAFRDTTDITPLTDSKGGFAGYNQKYYNSETKKFVDVTVPPEYCFVYTYNKDEDEIYGQSAFVAAHYHWDKKRRLYYLYEQAVEKGAMPPKVLEVEEGNKDTDDQKSSNLNAIKNFGVDSAVLVPTGYKLNPYDAGKGRLDPMPGIDHHNGEMARSVLAQFILLGSNETGSFALSKSHSDLFMMALRGTMNELEEHFNSYLIPQLIGYNFETPFYPEFKFNDMSDDTAEFIESIFLEVVKKEGSITDDFIKGLVEQVANRLDINLDELSKVDQPEEEADTEDPEDPEEEKPVEEGELSRSKKKTRFASDDEEVSWRRDLTEAEQNVNLASIQNKMETQEEKFVEAMRPQFDKVTELAIKDVTKIIDSGSLKDLDQLELKGAESYSATMVTQSLTTYTGSKKIASDDLDVNIPATPQESKDYFTENAKAVTEKQFSDLLFIIKSTVSSEFHKGQLSKKVHFGVEEVTAALSGDFDAFFEGKISLTGSIFVSQAINRARDDVFSTSKEEIASYQYSAILDSSTCPLCKSLDGSVVTQAEYESSQFQPPNHAGCRCIWIAIKKDQSTLPEETGFPDISEDVIKQNQTLNHKH